ncbi:uncharacterized protein LOC111711391 isoform X3 [Eurytemora carolleeae]|uniref:uncharacterized protein LOC111711391 isoform X3 n=1 Tax=Eurytemora carolleeae TaxID=1294199 RepID=UPI000C76F658|nr:uncharacterized protein LOC111711391 isoform X3 [Eurytemora carolleeae]|eukprot:XP_023341503.1 uncharacterized protein LOC111711391 isoform X3 [Eurytemora affinis]
MSKPCKFYIQGYCRNGGGCTFLHTQVTHERHGNILKTYAAETKSGEINHVGHMMSSRLDVEKERRNKYSSSEEGSEDETTGKTKVGIISCICLYQTWDPEMVKCLSCGNYSHSICYGVNLEAKHTCIHCAVDCGNICGNVVIDEHFKKEKRSYKDKQEFVFKLNKRRVLKSILKQEFRTCQPGENPTIEFLKIRFGFSGSYASKITLDLVNNGYIKFFGGFSFDASKILQELGYGEEERSPGADQIDRETEIGACCRKRQVDVEKIGKIPKTVGKEKYEEKECKTEKSASSKIRKKGLGKYKPKGNRDNGRMVTSLLPLMSVLTLARVPALDNMCTDIIRHILQFLDYRSKKMLRGVSSALKNRVEGCGDKLVHYWRFNTEFTRAQLIKFADEVETVLGFEAEDARDDGVEYLVKKHPEILMFQLGKENYWEWETSEFTSTGLNKIFSLPSLSTLIIVRSIEFISGINVNIVSKQLQTLQLICVDDDRSLNNYWFLQILEQCGSTLKSLTLRNSIITGEIFIKYKGTLPCLENLNMSYCKQLTNKGLLQILQLCGSTLRSLDISNTNITGENLSEYKGTLPCLENLNMSECYHFTNKGVLQILQLCGSTLRSLDISVTKVTGENLSEYKVILPCLENLIMSSCEKFTNKGLLQILQLCGSTLRSLDISYTEITGENLSEYKGTLPCLENLDMQFCDQLINKGLLQILQLCGSTLRSLDISETKITGENLSEYKRTLPFLENLNMRDCEQLTNKGLLQILQLCGSTLRSLDISKRNITGENLSEYKGTLPCLENLNMSDFKQLTNKELLEILQLCGSTLRSLDISNTNITGENLSEYKGTLPCLENLNMRYCKQLTYKGLLQILQLCRSTLRFLDISGTNVAGENLSEYKGTFTLKTFSY